jgi:ABC-type dipeptide/oligopeptide/nickel transport system ATPase component
MTNLKESALKLRQGDVKPAAKIIANQHIEKGNFKKTLDLLKHMGKKVKVDKSTEGTSKAIWTIEGTMNEMKLPISDEMFKSLKKGDKIKIGFDSSVKKGNENTYVVKSKSKSAKYNLEKITLKNVANPVAQASYLYNRQGKVTMAQGDMAVTMSTAVKESVNEDDDPCWDTHKKVGTKMKGGKRVNDCVPKSEAILTRAAQRDKDAKKAVKTLKDIRKGKYKGVKMANEEIDLSEGLNPHQIALLKKNYSSIDKIDPSGPAYKKAKGFMKQLQKDELMDLAKAKVKFISQMAADELRKTHKVKMKATEYMESVEESSAAYGKSIDRIRDKKKKAAIKPGELNKLARLKNMMKNANKESVEESVELDEAIDFRKAHQEIKAYAKKSGGIDKTDFEKVAYYVKAIGDNQNTPNVANKAFMAMKKHIADMDTDPRDGVMLMLKKHGMFKNGRLVQESIEEAKAPGKLGPNASREDKINHTMKIMKMYPANKGKSEKELRKGATDYIDQVKIKNKKTDAYIAKMKAKKESVDEAALEEKTKWKMGDGRPRNGARIENDRFWNLPYDSLKYIAKDAGEAMKANPTARKATTGPGNWADQVADAATVMQWRKKNGIKESKKFSDLR